MKVAVSRAFCGRRVITVGKDDRTFYAKELRKNEWAVCDRFGTFAKVTKVRQIELAVHNYIKSYGN